MSARSPRRRYHRCHKGDCHHERTRKTALITGANKGIGREIARQLGHKGYAVWLGCRDATRGEQAAADLRKEGIDGHVLALDVTSDASVKAAAATYAKTNDTLDVLVNNAGVSTGGYVVPTETSLDDMHALYEVNVFGPVRVTQAFVPFLRKAGQGRIVMIVIPNLPIAAIPWR